jgi:hypothetical protein
MNDPLEEVRRPEVPAGTSLLQMPNARAKWWIVAAIVALLVLWEAASHRWVMRLPMADRHQLDVLVGGGVTATTVLAYLSLVQKYERRLARAAQLIWDLDQRLRRKMAERGDRLLRIARELRIAERALVCRCAAGAAQSSAEGRGPSPAGVADPLEALNASLEQLEELAREEAAPANLGAVR